MNKYLSDYEVNGELNIDLLIDDFSPYIKKIINNMVRDNLSYEDKEEILSDVFFIVWKNKLNNVLYLDSYIAGITRNLVKEKLKSRRVDIDISDVENVIEYSVKETFIEEREEITQIEKMLKEFKDVDVEIFKMFYYVDTSIKDIAKKLNLSEFNVKQRLYRVRKKLKLLLKNGGNKKYE